MADSAAPVVSCSFCGKSQDEVRKIIAGPMVYICDECIDLCNDILAEEETAEPRNVEEGIPPSKGRDWPADAHYVRCILCRMPNPVSNSKLIPDRGVLCLVCIDAIMAVVDNDLEEES